MDIQFKKIIDISVTLHNNTAVYPGNPPVQIEQFQSSTGLSRNSKMVLGTHVGTHIDAPGHALEKGLDIDDLSLNLFIGPCRVLDLTHVKGAITVHDLQTKKLGRNERILFKTQNSRRGFETFYDDYVYLSAEAAQHIVDSGVILCGIDAWSVKQKGSQDNRPHTILLEKLIPIVEGLDLKHVIEGSYYLIVLPLKVQAPDGAPARAILLESSDI